jgi:hypothetical protein
MLVVRLVLECRDEDMSNGDNTRCWEIEVCESLSTEITPKRWLP